MDESGRYYYNTNTTNSYKRDMIAPHFPPCLSRRLNIFGSNSGSNTSATAAAHLFYS
jgi:hypothetical protein